MLTVLSAVTKRSLNRPLAVLYSQMSQAQNVVSKGPQRDLNREPTVIPFSSRLHEGRALAEDVWSIFKYTPILSFVPYILTCRQCGQSAIRLSKLRSRLYELWAPKMDHSCRRGSPQYRGPKPLRPSKGPSPSTPSNQAVLRPPVQQRSRHQL